MHCRAAKQNVQLLRIKLLLTGSLVELAHSLISEFGDLVLFTCFAVDKLGNFTGLLEGHASDHEYEQVLLGAAVHAVNDTRGRPATIVWVLH